MPDVAPVIGGLYEHYKGGHYVVIQLAAHHDTSEPMVVYLSLTHGGIFVRPLNGSERDPDGWLTPVVGLDVERFKFICEGY